MIRGVFILVFIFLYSSRLFSNDNLYVDSLHKELLAASNDTDRLNLEFKLEEARWNMRTSFWDSLAQRANRLGLTKLETDCYNNLGFIYMTQGQPGKALSFHQKCIAQFKELKDPIGLARSLNNIGYIYQHTGRIEKALEHYNRSLEIREGIDDYQGIGESLINIGFIYQDLGEIKKALDYYHEALGIYEGIGHLLGKANALNNIASIYSDQGELEQTLRYHENCLAIRKELGNKSEIANSLNNIGQAHRRMKDFDTSLDYIVEAFQLYDEVGNLQGSALSMFNIGILYQEMGDYQNALPHYQEALRIREGLGDIKGISQSLFGLGENYLSLEMDSNAAQCGKRALELSYQLGFPEQIRDAAKLLFKVHKREGDSELALEYYELFVNMRDSIFNDATKRASIRKEMQYEFEKEMVSLQKEQEKRQLIADQEKQEQRWILIGVSSGLALLGLFAVFLSKRIRVIRNQKRLIEDQHEDLELQKALVDEKNKDITDSLRYARRIQHAILPEMDYARDLLPEHFILFKPKDIVSGDFYWISEYKEKVFFSVCDCTGHGVPGAFMSMIGTSLLREVVNEKGITRPGAIFDEVRSGFINALKQTTEEVEQKDGMDAILCRLDANNILEFASAYNSLYIIRGGEMEEFKGDSQPVGFHGGVEKPFSTQSQKLNKGDVIYLTTDGFQDQFGGPRGKKFKTKKLKSLLLKIHGLPMEEQHKELSRAFDDWKGDQDQVDDVCIMGLRI